VLHTHIGKVLPVGLTRPLFARLEGTRKEAHCVRAGELHHSPTGFILRPTWQGEAFQILWEATDQPEARDARGPEVHFAVHSGHELVPVGSVILDRGLQHRLRWGF
jgi:hypothetical protein